MYLCETSLSRIIMRTCLASLLSVTLPPHIVCWAHGELFSKSWQIKPKSDCIYHASIDLEQQTDTHRPFSCSKSIEKW